MLKRKMLSILLCVIMLLGLIPAEGFARGEDTSDNITYVDKVEITTANYGQGASGSLSYSKGTLLTDNSPLISTIHRDSIDLESNVVYYTLKINPPKQSLYSLDSSGVTVYINGTNCGKLTPADGNKSVSVTYSPESPDIALLCNSIEVSMDSGIAFGSVDKSNITGAAKTIGITNRSSAASGSLAAEIRYSSEDASTSNIFEIQYCSLAGGGSSSESVSGSDGIASINVGAANASAFTVGIMPDVAAGTYNAALIVRSASVNPVDTEYSNGQPSVATLKLTNSNFETRSIQVWHTVMQKQSYEADLSYTHTIMRSAKTSEEIFLNETDSFIFDYNYLPWEDQARYGLLT